MRVLSAMILILFGVCPAVLAMNGKVSHTGGVAFEVDDHGNAREVDNDGSASLAKAAESNKDAMETITIADSPKKVGDIGMATLNLEQNTMQVAEDTVAAEGFSVESQAQRNVRLEAYEMPQVAEKNMEVDVVAATTITKGNGGFSTSYLAELARKDSQSEGTEWAKDAQAANFKVKAAGGQSASEAFASNEKATFAKLAEVSASEKAARAAAKAQEDATQAGTLVAEPQDDVVDKVTAELDAAEVALMAGKNSKEAALAEEAVKAAAPKDGWVRDEPQGKHKQLSFVERTLDGASMIAHEVAKGTGHKAAHDANRAAAEANEQAIKLVWSHVSAFFTRRSSSEAVSMAATPKAESLLDCSNGATASLHRRYCKKTSADWNPHFYSQKWSRAGAMR